MPSFIVGRLRSFLPAGRELGLMSCYLVGRYRSETSPGPGLALPEKNIKCINLWFKAQCFTSWQILVRHSLNQAH